MEALNCSCSGKPSRSRSRFAGQRIWFSGICCRSVHGRRLAIFSSTVSHGVCCSPFGGLARHVDGTDFRFFGGGLLLTMFVYTRDRRWLVSGVCALLAIVLAYWPVHSALLESFSGYAKEWGKPFANWNAIGDLLSIYLLFGTASWVTFLIAILVLIALSRKRVRDAKVKASVFAGCSTLIALVISLKMETPPLRTVAYLATPIAFILVTVMTEPFREGTLQRFRLHMMTAVLLAAFAFALQSGKKFHFRPIEAWLETAQRIEKGFPNGTEVVAQFRPKWLRVYLPGSYPIVQDLDVSKISRRPADCRGLVIVG